MKSINAALIGLTVFLLAYSLCFWTGLMPKFYPALGEITTVAYKGQIAVKFVGSAVVGMAAGLIAMLIGALLPAGRPRLTVVCHLVLWGMMLAACFYLVGREAREYLF